MLLAADTAPIVIALLQALFFEVDHALETSVLHERLARELNELAPDADADLKTPQAYVAEWLAKGWLTRRLPPGANEEVYELSTDTLAAIRFITGALKPRTATTEGRLAIVIQQLARLAEETDPDATSRLKTLLAERARIDRAIAYVQRAGVKVLPADRALERARELIALAGELTGDFRSVRDKFDQLNRGLRQSLMEHEGSRGDVLDSLFAGVDLIGESEEGRTFSAFWRLLTDSEQAATLTESLEAVTSRPFARSLDSSERKFLLGLTATLMDEGSGVHDVLQNFARSLKSFVQSREFLEQRRLHSLLKQTTTTALQTKDLVRTNQSVGFELALTSSRIRSVSQWVLHDPEKRVIDSEMGEAEASELDLETVNELVRQSEIDFRTLKQHVLSLLAEHSQVSVGDVLREFPAEQGLGSVVGYVALGARHGEVTEGSETVAWIGQDKAMRQARVPAIFFMRERCHELAQ
jgi:hypothetical protein